MSTKHEISLEMKTQENVTEAPRSICIVTEKPKKTLMTSKKFDFMKHICWFYSTFVLAILVFGLLVSFLIVLKKSKDSIDNVALNYTLSSGSSGAPTLVRVSQSKRSLTITIDQSNCFNQIDLDTNNAQITCGTITFPYQINDQRMKQFPVGNVFNTIEDPNLPATSTAANATSNSNACQFLLSSVNTGDKTVTIAPTTTNQACKGLYPNAQYIVKTAMSKVCSFQCNDNSCIPTCFTMVMMITAQ